MKASHPVMFPLFLLLGVAWHGRAETISISPSADAVIYSTKAGDTFEYANGSGQFLHAGVNGSGGGNRVLRSLLRFDLSAHIPPGATVTQVVLRVTKDTQGSTGTIRLHRLTRAWSEGATDAPSGEGIGVQAGPGDATWTTTNGSIVWSAPGGDFTPTASAEAAVTAQGPVIFSSPQLLADVRAMAANASANHGWILLNTDEATGGNSLQFDSRSNPAVAARPALEIGYTTQPYPLLYYNFSEGGGTVVTNQGSIAVNGTLMGAAGNERWVSGPRGGALEFDGQDLPDGDYIATGLTAATLGLNSSNYTAAAWLLFTKPVGDNMVFGQISATSNVLHLGVRNNRAHMGHWANDITGGTTLATGVWHHVVWEYRQGHQRIFLNGNLEAGPTAKGLLAAASELMVGQSGPPGYGFQGRLDDVVVYNQPLHLMQIRHLAAGGDPRALPADEFAGNPTYYTAPFGLGGTWNLYQFRGTLTDRPRTWVDAQNQAAASTDPSGISGVPGHLADVLQRQENFFLERIAGFTQFWIGLTDHENYGATEAGSNRNGQWKWTSGASYSYQNWNSTEPNNAGANGEDGVSILAGSGLWNDFPNGITPQDAGAPLSSYIVEWQVASPVPVPGAQVMPPILPTPLAGRGPANAAFGVRAVSNAGTLDNIVRAVAALQGGLGTIQEARVATINTSDPQAGSVHGIFPSDVPMPGNTAADDNDILHVYKGRLTVTNTTEWTFVLRSDDGGAIRIPGRVWTTAFAGVIDIRSPDILYRERGSGEIRGVMTLPAGLHDIEVLVFERTGGAGHELYAAPGSHDLDTDTRGWRLVGHRPRANMPLPGIQMQGGTNWLVRTSAPGGNAAITNLLSLAHAELELNADPNTVAVSRDFIDFVDPQAPGSGGSYPSNLAFPNDTAAADDDFAMEATGLLEIPAAGDYQFGFRGDDGASLRIVGQAWSNLLFTANASSVISGDTLVHNSVTGDSLTRASIRLAAGTYQIRALYFERGGGAYFEVYGDSLLVPQPDLLRGGAAHVEPDAPVLSLAVVSPVQMAVPSVDPVTGILTLSWNSMPGASYRVEWSVDHTTWTPLLSGIASQGATTLLMLSDTFGSPFVLFRILEEN